MYLESSDVSLLVAGEVSRARCQRSVSVTDGDTVTPTASPPARRPGRGQTHGSDVKRLPLGTAAKALLPSRAFSDKEQRELFKELNRKLQSSTPETKQHHPNRGGLAEPPPSPPPTPS